MLYIIFFCSLVVLSGAFVPANPVRTKCLEFSISNGQIAHLPTHRTSPAGRRAADGDGDSDDNTAAPTKIDTIVKDLHSQGYVFRIVVIGNGAILESTSVLGPHMAESVSPKTGERLITLASDDRSFEFHLKVDQIGKVTFTETERQLDGGEKKKLRIVRMLNEEGGPICSLILADSSNEAAEWFKTLTIRYGYEVQKGD